MTFILPFKLIILQRSTQSQVVIVMKPWNTK